MAAKAQTAPKAPSIPPNQSLYLSNLPDLRRDDLRRELYMLFSTYGSVLDINMMRNAKMRGQAHVVFKDVQTAVQALRNLEGFEFFGKNMRIQYAKSKSDFISKLDGTYKMPLAGDAAGGAAASGATTGLAGTALQQSVFRGGPPAAQPPATGAGVKRTREEEDGDESMEEDDDDDAMEESSEED